MKALPGFALALFCIAAFGPSHVALSGQAAVGPRQAPIFRARTDIVELDVSVLDANRRPIRGLTRDNFVVLEDGQPQDIEIFQAIDASPHEPPATPWMRDVTPDVTTNQATVTRVWVIVLDDAMIPTDPHAITTSLKVVREIIDRLGPNDVAAVVFTTDSRRAQDFTNDRALLLAALEQFNPGWASWTPPPMRNPMVNPDSQFEIGAVLTLRNVMDTLSEMPHHHKAVFWVSAGLSLGFGDVTGEVMGRVAGGATGAVNAIETGAGNVIASALASIRIIELSREVMLLGRRANVPIYAIHPCGLVAPGGIDKCSAAAVGAESLMAMASATGGRALINTNEYTPGIQAAFDENASYYLLGYRSSNTRTDGRIRQLDVRVSHPSVVEVRARSDYIAPKTAGRPPRNASERLDRATAAPVALPELPLRATVAPFAIPGSGRDAAVTVALGVSRPLASGQPEGPVTVVTDLRISAYTTEGDHRGTERGTVNATLRSTAGGEAFYEAVARINLPPGRFRLRIAAYQQETGRTGTVMVDVTVPGFAKEPASVSGVAVSTHGDQPPPAPIRSVLPFTPTSQREFRRQDRATAVFYLYQRPQPAVAAARVVVQIIDGRGVVVVDETPTVPAERFVPIRGLRTAEFQYPIPLDRLEAGPYLLRFETTIGSVVTERHVQFSVR